MKKKECVRVVSIPFLPPSLSLSLLGGALFGVFGSYTNRYGREPIVFIGFLCHIVCYLLSYLFLPDAAILHIIQPQDSYGALGVYGIMSK